MNQDGIFKGYYKLFKGAIMAELQEAEEIALAVLEVFKAEGDKQSVRIYQRDLEKNEGKINCAGVLPHK